MASREERAAEADRRAQERGSANAKVGRTSRGFINAKHPDTGLDVVFLPGELLPDWVDLPPELEA
jgi:hypothetical protein